jgi:hypothetical protein
MLRWMKRNRLVWLAIGLACGLAAAGLWPHAPLRAVATDHAENVVLATGMVDDAVEAVYFLDPLTGILQAAVPSIQTKGVFQSTWAANVYTDLQNAISVLNANIQKENKPLEKRGQATRPIIQMPQKPAYAMVTGAIDIRRGAARLRPGRAMIYIAESNTGIVLAYAVPWSPEMHTTGQLFQNNTLTLWAFDQFSKAIVREQE